MFKIIGADGRQYGPVAAAQLQEWIAAGRANSQTMVQVEGSTEWRPLHSFPEFAGQFSASPAPPILTAYDQRKSKLVAGILGILLGWLGAHRFYLGYTAIGVVQIVVTICTGGIGGLWGIVEGVLILVGSMITSDAEGRPLKDQ